MPHLVLAGGGHAHIQVLRSLSMRAEPGLRLTLVSPHSYATYSGMVPGVLAGQYRWRQAQIDVRALAARAGAAFLADRVVGVDPQRRLVRLHERPALSYDLLSLDVGSEPAGRERIGAALRAATVKPIEVAVSDIEAALADPAPSSGHEIVVVGAGAGGCEIAFALAARLRGEQRGHVTVCDLAERPLAGRHPNTSRAVQRAMAGHGIDFVGGVAVVRVDDDTVRLGDGRVLPATLVVWSTGARGPDFLARSGLPVDDGGFLRVGDDLRCAEYPEIFAAGDCAALASHPELAKAGVYAVRQGPVLTANLRAAAQAKRTRPFRPQRDVLALLNTGDGRAILSRGRLALRGRWAWRLKDWIDRRFVARYARPAPNERTTMTGPMIVCGGCAAKVGADALGRVLARLHITPAEGVVIGLEAPDDAAVFAHPAGTLAVATTDAFPPFADDLHLVGRVAVTNAASDLYAMGAEASAALAFVCLPRDDSGLDEERLEHFLRGALAQLDVLGIPLVGGHTIAGEQTIVGFSMHGYVAPDAILRKSGARAGDVLLLTKALGTGVILAAARAGFADADWVEQSYASMLRSNRGAMHVLRRHGVRALTDVTGFGLAGHLTEMLRAAGLGARLRRSSIPALPGALELLGAGWRSSFHPGDGHGDDPLGALCHDPQTSGGLLAAVPSQAVEAILRELTVAGEEAHVIGEVVPESGWSLT